MKKILVLTSIYPSSDNPRGFTPVVHYYTKEWAKLGYEVKVIHNQTKFPRILYYTPKGIRDILEAKLGFAMPEIEQTREKHYQKDGVKIHRLPIFRIFPFVNFFKQSIKHQIKKIIDSNDLDQFNPDCILAHWTVPQLSILLKLKSVYKCPISLVIHGQYGNNNPSMLKEVDAVGFRSLSLKNLFIEEHGILPKSFICYSGIDPNIITHFQKKSFNNTTSTFVFVGNLIPRKYPDVVLKAIHKHGQVKKAIIKIIGDGPMRDKLIDYTRIHNFENRVSFLGHIKREEVLRNLEDAEYFIMVSKGEVFGLVYIEAMAKGCIVVASKNEGMEGVIVDGVNGFMCKPGDIDELAAIIARIDSLTNIEKMQISYNAIETAKRLTEKQVAIDYLSQIL